MMSCNDQMKLREDLYSQDLNTINGVKLTFREVDLISCIISGRTAKGAASLLDISVRTAENHIYSAMSKMDVSSREGVINFIEKSQKLPLIQDYYKTLIVQCAFENALRSLGKLKKDTSSPSFSLKCSDVDLTERLTSHLERHLQLANMRAILDFSGEKTTPKSLDLSECKNYTTALLKILQEYFSKEDIQTAFRKFDQMQGASLHKKSPSRDDIPHESEPLYTPKKKIYSPMKLCGGIALIACFFMIRPVAKVQNCSLELAEILELNMPKNDFRNRSIIYYTVDPFGMWRNDQIRSELIIPEDKKLLNRPELFAQLDRALAGKDIRSVGLVGIGGAGKTTLARQYSSAQKEKIIWEINTETPESLRASFGKLAQKLALTEDDQKVLRDIQNIMALDEREEKILEFVKERLKLASNWFLLYDNMENFTDVGTYFPQDPKTWGQGKILITSRNVNIQNNSQIGHVVSIGELNQKEKGALFRQIMGSGTEQPLSCEEQEKETAFLENIPPFPLDISVAAYYIKTTTISYESFLERLEKQDNEFASVQENLLKEAGTYLKTRYSIITLSIEEMIKSHKDFEDLLLFISMMDSQNIPKDLINKYKNEAIVDNFMYHLKKNSLISHKVHPTPAESTFSIHRSTQAIILTYLRKKRDLDNNKQPLESIASVLETYVNDCEENFEYPQMDLLKSHCEAFLRHDDLLTNSIKGSISLSLARIYCYQNVPEKTQSILKIAQEILDKNPSENQDKIAHALRILGHTYVDLGNEVSARAYLEKSCELYKKNLTKDQMGFARTLGLLARAENALGDYENSKKLCEQTLKIYERHPNKNPVQVAWALSFLGHAYLRLGYNEKALDALNKSLDIYNEYAPHCHQGIHRVLLGLGSTHRKLGDYNKAKSCFEKSVEAAESYSEKFYGKWCSQIFLGAVYGELKNYKKAKELLQPGIIFCEQFYGENNIGIACPLHEMGIIYLRENNLDEAELYLKRSFNILQKANHVEIYMVLESFTELYLKKSTLAEQKDPQQAQQFKNQAVEYLKQALEVINTRFPLDSPHKERIETKLKGLGEN